MSQDVFDELIRKREGEVTTRRAAELEEALTTSPELRAEQAKVDQLVDALSKPNPELEGLDLRAGLWTQPVPERTTASSGWRWVALAAAAVLSLSLGVWTWQHDDGGEIRGKGGSGALAGVSVLVVGQGEVHPVGATLHASEALGFEVSNLPGSPYGFLAIYGVDSAGAVHWFYPAWGEGAPPPRSISIESLPQPLRLPQAVRHPYALGGLELHVLFSARPVSVLEVEAGRLPSGAEVLHTTQHVEIIP